MSLTKWLAVVMGVALLAPVPAYAQEDEDEEEAGDEEEASADDAEDEDEAPKKKKKKKKGGDEEEEQEEEEVEEEDFVKQNLSGHDLGTKKKENLFEKDRFYVDKVDTEKTEKGTLVQGSISSSAFAYTESGGNYARRGIDPNMPVEQGPNSSRFSRYYTELRLQTDFRHIAASRWEARIDARTRFVMKPEQATADPLNQRPVQPPNGTYSQDANRIQSGFNGANEYDLRELWLFRSGKRSDIFLGRQFVPDLGGIKFDGLRVDYANSATFTLIGFGGLYPVRGSRSITTDYKELKGSTYEPAGRFVGTGGFGAAYRTESMYGAFGGVVLAPLAGEQPRVFVTSQGYYRRGALVDLYHLALVDLYGSQGAGLTNASVGVNVKPSPRLRLTGAFHRIDVDTLAVQANAFLTAPTGTLAIENETYFRRLATNSVRAGVSAGLGHFNRFEASVYSAYRQRGDVTIPFSDLMGNSDSITLKGTKGIEVGGSFIDRRSIKDLRLGIDVSRSYQLGAEDVPAYQRSVFFNVRLSAARELSNGHGEWEAEVSYTNTKDSSVGTQCIPGTNMIVSCYGSSKGTIIAAGGNLYYRINTDWFALGTAYLTRQTLDAKGNEMDDGVSGTDPDIYGFTLFGRAAYRF